MSNYYKYTANSNWSVFLWSCSSYYWLCNWPAIACNVVNWNIYIWNESTPVCFNINDWQVFNYKAWSTIYFKDKPWYYKFNENFTYDWEYNVSTSNSFSCTLPDRYATCTLPSNLKSSKVYITSSQTTSMWTSLVQAWSWLVHLWIQLMPYAIWFTIIMILFALFKNWWKLKTNRQLNRIKRQKIRRERAEIKKYRNK